MISYKIKGPCKKCGKEVIKDYNTSLIKVINELSDEYYLNIKCNECDTTNSLLKKESNIDYIIRLIKIDNILD